MAELVKARIPAFIGRSGFGIGGRRVALDADGVGEVTQEELELLASRFPGVDTLEMADSSEASEIEQPETVALDLSGFDEDQLRAFAQEADIDLAGCEGSDQMAATISAAIGEIAIPVVSTPEVAQVEPEPQTLVKKTKPRKRGGRKVGKPRS